MKWCLEIPFFIGENKLEYEIDSLHFHLSPLRPEWEM